MHNPAVLHIITKLDLGGAQKSCLALIQELQQNYPNFDVYFISGTQGELIANTKTLKNVYLLDSMLWELNPRNFWAELKNFYQIITIMRQIKNKHDNVIVHTHTIKAGTIGRWAALFAGIKHRVHTIHGFSFNLYQNKLIWLFFYLIELFNSLITTHFICVSSQDLKAGSEIFPFFNQKASIIRAATLAKKTTPLPSFGAAKRPPHTTTIGTIASLKTGKNLFDLLKSFKYATDKLKRVQLEIIGDGPLRPYLETYLLNNKLHNQVKILGWVPSPAQHTKNWDAFIFTSLWEGLPCAVVEMIDSGIPTFSYNVGGISDLIDKSKLFYHGKWVTLITEIIETQSYPPKTKLTSLSQDFYIPKMALDHANLYKQLFSQ